jgi:hypothetical protein
MSKATAGVVSVRLGAEDQERLRQVAEAKGLSVSEMVREAVTHQLNPQPIMSAVSVPASRALAHSGTAAHGLTNVRIEGGSINIRC